MSDVTVEETAFATWDDCLELSNGTIDLVVTTGLGPRILSCGFTGGENLFSTDEDQEPMLDGYRIHGGHRLWHAPEDIERTYVPDEEPVDWTETDSGVRLEQPTEARTGIRKTISLALDSEDAVVEVTHELTNEGLWPIELAPWAISVMRTGGTAVVPLTRGDPADKLPDRSLALWPYASLADDRLEFGDEVVTVDQDSAVDGRIKIGATAADEWAAYVAGGVGFVKEFAYDETATYPDRGSAVEVYTDDSGLELETLGPMQELDPGESAVHTETWRLVGGIDAATTDELADAIEQP